MTAAQASDVAQLARRLSALGISDLAPLAGGASSLTYRARLGARPVVVKVAPAGVAPLAHRDVLRQARIVRALGTTAVPVPEIIHEDAGRPPEIPPLFVMAFLPGSSTEPLFDRSDDGADVEEMAARLRHATAVMAALHRVDPGRLALGDEPVVGPEAEVGRWCRLFETVDPALVPAWPEVAGALRRKPPAAMAPAVVHGDFRLGNLLARRDRISAVIDWEIWTIGDPRIDVGWFLVNADPATYRRRTRFAGHLPGIEVLARIYEEELGCPVDALEWFRALALFKSAATWSLIVKHNRRRPTPDPDLEAMAEELPRLLALSAELAG